MAYLYPLQPNFSRGELGPRLHGRADIEHYLAALKTCTNFTVLKQGGLRKRPGFKFVATAKDQSKRVRMLPFIFSQTQAFALEVGEGYTRPFTLSGRILQTTQAITAISKANPAVVTYAGADSYANGNRILLSSVVGMTQVNNREFIVAGVNTAANTFQLQGVDSTGYDAYVSGGFVSIVTEFATPWQEADLAALDYASTNDVMTVCHKGYQPREIARLSDTSWTVTPYDFLNGPFMPEPNKSHANLKFSSTGNMVPDMTSDTAPSGTVINGGGSTPGWNAFDRDISTEYRQSIEDPTPFVGYDLGAGNSKTAVGYGLRMRATAGSHGLSKWRFEGQVDGSSDWVTLDSQIKTAGWGHREKIYFPINNDNVFRKYRVYWEGSDFSGTGSGTNSGLSELAILLKDTEQAATTCTASSLIGINRDTGFSANDVGRHINVRGSDGLWRTFKITGFTSTTVVTGKWFGCPLPDDGDVVNVWQLGSWYGGNWPQHITNYDERRVFANTDQEPQSVWLTKSNDLYDYGRSQPLVADDGITFTLSAKRMAPITWLEAGDDLILGTTAGVRTLGAASSNEAFSATSVKQRRNTAYASKPVKPATVGTVLIFVDYFGTVIREFFYSFEADAYVSPDLSILSDHLLASGVSEIHYAQSPDSTVWMINGNGELITLTYERDQKVAAMTRVAIAGGDAGTPAVVESMCVIPGPTRDEVWIAVRRTIGGQTKRYIEQMVDQFEDDALADANFLDASLVYSGAATNTLSGLWHLEGQTVSILADGTVLTPQVVTLGKLTLPGGFSASKICVGKQYTALGRTLAVSQGRDGTQLGRRKLTGAVIFDVMQTLGLKVRSSSGKNTYNVLRREATDPPGGPMNLRTGRYSVPIDQSWRDDGEFEFLSDTPEPLTIRGITPAYTSEGT